MIETFNERHELIMFCDMHGHSLKRNVFMYGCAKRTTDFIEKRKFLLAKVIPSLLNQRNYLFSFNDTRFRYEKGKINTARIVINKEF